MTICVACNYTCLTCSAASASSCLSCPTGANRDNNVTNCPCSVGFYDGGTA